MIQVTGGSSVQSKGIFIATPCYGGMVTEPHFRSCLALREEFFAINLDHTWLTLGNESLITRARNVCAASFLNESDLSHLLFIDSDIEFSPADVAHLWNLCDLGADIAVGIYRMKKAGSPLAAWIKGKHIKDLEPFHEPFEVDYAGTGFMMIPRKTLENLKKNQDVMDFEEGQIGQCWNFFDTGIDGDLKSDDWKTRNYLPEDYWFCKRVRNEGMRIMADPKIKLKHHGTCAY